MNGDMAKFIGKRKSREFLESTESENKPIRVYSRKFAADCDLRLSAPISG
jgi:hypothetical protein